MRDLGVPMQALRFAIVAERAEEPSWKGLERSGKASALEGPRTAPPR
jgi:hypothetical protein